MAVFIVEILIGDLKQLILAINIGRKQEDIGTSLEEGLDVLMLQMVMFLLLLILIVA